MNGTIEVLNCGEGDLKIVVEEKDPINLERAKRIITDMLKRGYALFVHGKGDTLIRVKQFDSKKAEYIIADGPLAGDPESLPESTPLASPMKSTRKVPMTKAKVTAVGRSAGG